jgi:hypothetical protein
MTTFKNISDGEYMRDKISCLRSYFNNFSTLLQHFYVINLTVIEVIIVFAPTLLVVTNIFFSL